MELSSSDSMYRKVKITPLLLPTEKREKFLGLPFATDLHRHGNAFTHFFIWPFVVVDKMTAALRRHQDNRSIRKGCSLLNAPWKCDVENPMREKESSKYYYKEREREWMEREVAHILIREVYRGEKEEDSIFLPAAECFWKSSDRKWMIDSLVSLTAADWEHFSLLYTKRPDLDDKSRRPGRSHGAKKLMTKKKKKRKEAVIGPCHFEIRVE